MKILPVLDLLDGLVVRGVAGRRDEYRPVESVLAAGARPLDIACGFRDRLGLGELYVADLDAILHGRPNLDVYRSLAAEGFSTMIDAGVRAVPQAHDVLEAGAQAVVAGLETCPGPELLEELCRRFDPARVVFSLDMQAGRLLGDVRPWQSDDAFTVAARAVEAGIERLIVLDLAQVGVGAGVGTGPLCRRLREAYPQLELITGGGVRDADDLQELKQLGVDAVLIASALHKGRIGREELGRMKDEG